MLRFIGRIFPITLRFSWNCDYCGALNHSYTRLGVPLDDVQGCLFCGRDNVME